MGKLNFPSNGLYPLVADNIQAAHDSITAAQRVPFTIPNKFVHKGYLQKGLPSELASINKRISEIYSIVSETDKSFRSTVDTMESYNESLDLSIMQERGRLVK